MENVDETRREDGHTTVIIQQPKSNGLGTAGFVLAILGFIFSWIPVLGWIIWFLGAVFSFCGVFKAPRGLAIAGLVISFFGLIILLFAVTFLAALFGLAAA